MKTLGVFLLSLMTLVVAARPAADGGIYHEGWIDFNKNGVKDVYEDTSADIDKRVADLLGQMTVEEKTCQMVTLYGYGRVLKDPLPTEGWKNEIWKDGIANIDEHLNGIGKGAKTHPELVYPFSNHIEARNTVQRWFVEQTRLGIPVDFTNEGIHGLNHAMTTSLPAPIGIGSTWNRNLVREAGEIVGKEAKALGYTNVYAPILDVARDPRWGRVLECYGEEPYHISELGIQMVEGIQEQGVAATLKHYAAYSIPKGGRDAKARTDAHVAPRELHSLYMYPFKKVIQQSQPMGVMSSYNDWDGVPVSASYYFLTELLRKEYGFKGYVVSDSEAVEYVHTKHRVAPTYQDAVRQVVEAGLNVRTNFTQPKKYIEPLRKAIAEGQLSMEAVDRVVADVLRFKFEIGLFDEPYTKNDGTAEQVAGADRHQDFMLEMQKQSLVLLKNEGLLPLDAGKIRKVLVAGPLAKEENYMVSRYGPQGLDNINVYEGIAEYLKGKAEVVYAKGCEVVDEGWPDSEIVPVPMNSQEKNDIEEAVKSASGCDVIIAVLGEDELRTGESRSRTSLELPGRQQALLEALHATGKPVVLVLVNGQPLTINWADRNIPSILEAWFPGCMGGKAIAQTLFGEYNPGGKLTMTFPKTTGQLQYNFPFKPGSHGIQNRKGPNGAGNTRVVGALYPFGHGLSYTTFEYSALDVQQKKVRADRQVTVTVDVQNTGSVAGDEIVQLYVRDVASSVITYDSQLRGFERISLQPGEKKTVTFFLQPEDLQILDAGYKWTVEPGDFEVLVGASSQDIRLKGGFTVVPPSPHKLNYNESKVPEYTLPDPLVTVAGKPVRNSRQWERTRRPELLGLFETEMFGKMPGKPSGLHFKVLSETPDALGGKATRKEVEVYFDKEEKSGMTLLMYLPNAAKGPVPAFIGVNFKGNHATTDDPEVSMPSPERIAGYGPSYKLAARGENAGRWPYEYVIDNGYAVVTFAREDVDPDWHDGFRNGVHAAMDGDAPRRDDSWGSVAAWAWGLSRAMDYIETDKAIDSRKVAVIGHSRLGKAALWAGATDRRFALVVSNNSGCSGAALSRRVYGENLSYINTTFPHWFCTNYHKYNSREHELPFDQHELIALIAPRPVYVASASKDLWADPKGEMLSLVHASKVYQLYGYEPFTTEKLPSVNTAIHTERMGYHLREGKHDIGLYDWRHYVAFADRFFKSGK